MALRFGVIILLLSAMMAFQNCAKSPGGEFASNETGVAQTVDRKTFFFSDDYGRIGTGARELALNVESGEISVFAGGSEPVQSSLSGAPKYCLDDDERSELEALLSEDQVCAADVKKQKNDVVCTAIYRPSYAKYGSQTQSVVPVGESISGCVVKADFCSGKGDRIRQLIEQVKASLDSRTCSSF